MRPFNPPRPLRASVVAGHVDAADGGDVERRALLSTACTEDAAAAACGVVARAPVGQVEQLALLCYEVGGGGW